MTDTTPDIVDALAQLSFEMLDALTRSAAEHELSVTQLRLLGILRDREPTMASLAERLRLDRSSITGLIDRAEKRGLVARRASTDDARVTTIELTPAGRKTAEALEATVNRAVTALIAGTAQKDRPAIIRFAESITARP
ncbi:MarR family transcriptional regulator [soil metagenome]